MTGFGLRRRRVAALAAPLVGAIMAVGLTAPPAHADTIAEEAFDQATLKHAGDWYSSYDGPDDPTGWACLTAAAKPEGPLQACKGTNGRPIDPPGDGSLRLTDAQTWQTGFILAKKAFPSGAGLRFTIGVSSYGSKTVKTPADGISLFLLDGDKPMPTKPGVYGGGLGYYKIDGGYLGVGLDEYGNFSTSSFGAGGTKAKNPNSVAVRGASTVGNPLVELNKLANGQRISVPESPTWKQAERTVRIDLSPAGLFKVDMDFKDGKGFVNVVKPVILSSISGQPPVPKTLRIGMAASTGTKTNIHEVFNAKMETLGPKLSTQVMPDGPVNAGQPATFTMTTSNDSLAGPTTDTVTTTETFPEGVTPVAATGQGWDCRIEGQKVICNRPGKGDDVLAPGKNYPPVKVRTAVDPDAEGEKAATSTVETPGGTKTPPSQTKFTIKSAKGPQLSSTTKPNGPVVPGKEATFTTTVKNAPTAGRNTKPVTVKETYPEGVTPVSAKGEGWDCDIEGRTVTCKRPGDPALEPGDSYPPITVKTKVDPDAKGDKPIKTVTTPEGGKPVTHQDTFPVTPVKGPQLSSTTKPDAPVVPGKEASFTTTVKNAPTAGPNTKPVTVKEAYPEGVTPVSAKGEGWDCDIEGQTVTCKRPGDPALRPGGSYPPIKVRTAVGPDVTGEQPIETVTTPEGGKPVTNQDTFPVKPVKGPQLSSTTEPDGPVRAGEEASFTTTVKNAPNAGRNTKQVTVKETYPEGITPVSAKGDGWDCDIEGRTVTCKRPGAPALEPGDSYPPITVKTKVDPDAKGDKPIKTVTTPEGGKPVTNQDTVVVTPVKGPRLSSTTKPDGPVKAGEEATFTTKVKNAPDAGPNTKPVTVKETYPEGITPVTAHGDGWDCKVTGQTVTCRRPGEPPLKPGDTYPPITVKTKVDPDAKGQKPIDTVTTPEGGKPVKDEDAVDIVKVTPPELEIVTAPVGEVTTGKNTDFNTMVSAAQDGGPVVGPVTVKQTFPEGVTPLKAAGDDWKCQVVGQTVVCNRTKANSALQPGDFYPVITIGTKVAEDAEAGKKKVAATVDSPETPKRPDASAETTITVRTKAAPPKLSVDTEPVGEVAPGQEATFNTWVTNDPKAGDAPGPISASQTFPDGVKPVSASGDGWKCKTDGQKVTCVRTDKNPLHPGARLSPIVTKTKVAPGVSTGTKTVVTAADTPGTGQNPDVSTDCDFTVAKSAPPDLDVKTTVDGEMVPGKPTRFKVVVSNAKNAGPTTGEVKVGRTFPDGIKPVKAAGDGWKCQITGQTVTCTRPGTGGDALKPGSSYPPIAITTDVAADVTGDVNAITWVSTDRDPDAGRTVCDAYDCP